MKTLIAAAVLAVAAVSAAAALDPVRQAKVWEMEEQFIAAQLQHADASVLLGQSLKENWKDVPGDDRATFELCLSMAEFDRMRLVNVGVLDADDHFALEGRAPTPAQAKAFLTYRGRVLLMSKSSQGLVGELSADADRKDPLAPPKLTEAFRAFLTANSRLMTTLGPLNAELNKAQFEGYVSRWGLWD